MGEPKVKPSTDAEWAEYFRLENKALRARIKELEEDVAKMGLVIVSHAALLSRALRSHDLTDSLLRRDIARALAGEEKSDG